MAQLYYCRTNYHVKPPVDINPLIIQRYPHGRILAICARKGMIERINAMLEERSPRSGEVIPVGWWNLESLGLITAGGALLTAKLTGFDAIVIIGRDRIDQRFHSLLHMVEDVFICS